VIEIDKEEALEFIQENCDGDINKIFDMIRYQESEGCLYLVPKGMEMTNFRAASEMAGEKVMARRRRPTLHRPLEECIDMASLNRDELTF
jgi:hypothetical protein